MIAKMSKKKFFLVAGLLVFLGVATILGTNSAQSLIIKLKIYSQVIEIIQKEYVEETNTDDLFDNSIRGMLTNLDPHTTYLTKDYFERWNQNFEGYSGIGIYYDVIQDKITILSVFPGGPSEKAGILAGDRIVVIEGKPAVGIKRDEVPLRLMGPKGTPVTVSIERMGWTEPKTFTITRDEVHVSSIPYAFMIKPGIGYIALVRFSLTTDEELESSLKKLESQGMKSLILDLRSNGGGHLDAAVEVVDKFLPMGKLIVYTKGRTRNSFQERFSRRQSVYTVPMIVLIDRVSASASEIVAGALQDWDRAVILGETSFGKGLVQTQYPLEDGSALLLTTARFYTPSGRLIQRPYDDKSQQEYYTEAENDSLRDRMDKDANRPLFQTKILNRKVFGGGGITPDYFLKSEYDTLSAVMRKLVYDRNRYFFTFVSDNMKSNGTVQDFDEFMRSDQPGPRTLKRFYDFITQKGFEVTEQEFIRNQKDIQFFLKQYVAAKLWGEEAQYKVQITRDTRLLESLNYIDEAEALQKRAYHPIPSR